MKKLFIVFMIVVSMLLFAVPAMAQAPEWTVGSYEVVTYSTDNGRQSHDEYFLWYGTPEQKQQFRYYADQRMMAGIYFLQLGDGSNIKITCEKDVKGWYAWYHDSQGGSAPMLPLYGKLWTVLPAVLRQTISVLDETDPDLLLIYGCMISETVRVFYHPKHKTDKAFHEKMRLKAISGFLANKVPSRLV